MAKKTWEETWGTLEDGSFWNEDVPLDAIQKILDSGADVNAQNKYGSTPLSRAVEIDRMDLIDFFLEQGCEPSLNSALARAANCGRIKAAERLLKAGADPNYQANGRRSVLGNAAECEPEYRRELVQLLLENGAVPSQEDIRSFRYSSDPVLKEMLKHPDLYCRRNENEVFEWIQKHPNPTVKDFLEPLGDKGENVITRLVRAGSRTLEMAFYPLQEWATRERQPDLRKIFITVPREEKLMDVMRDFDKKLMTTCNYNQRRQERQRRADLADMLLAIEDPAMRQKMNDKMHRKWGLVKRVAKEEKE